MGIKYLLKHVKYIKRNMIFNTNPPLQNVAGRNKIVTSRKLPHTALHTSPLLTPPPPPINPFVYHYLISVRFYSHCTPIFPVVFK